VPRSTASAEIFDAGPLVSGERTHLDGVSRGVRDTLPLLQAKTVLARHSAAAIVLCAALPALSWLDGTGSVAWTMFSKSETYRLSVRIVTSLGTTES
jgi:hypothetical protein